MIIKCKWYCVYLSQVFISQRCVLEYLWVKLYVFRSHVKKPEAPQLNEPRCTTC